MNKKYILIVVLILIGAMVASAFGWAAVTRSNALTLLTPNEIMALRWNAMAKYYKAQGLQAGDSALYAGDDWFNKGYLIPVTGGSVSLDAMKFRSYKGYQALDIYHQSERNFVQAPVQALDIYHQSEWNFVQALALHYTPPGR